MDVHVLFAASPAPTRHTPIGRGLIMHGPAPRGATLLLGALVAAFGCALATRASAQDPVRLLPDVYKVILDNCQLRVMDYHLKVGQKEPMHSHPAGVFVYFFTDAKLKVLCSNAGLAMVVRIGRGDDYVAVEFPDRTRIH